MEIYNCDPIWRVMSSRDPTVWHHYLLLSTLRPDSRKAITCEKLEIQPFISLLRIEHLIRRAADNFLERLEQFCNSLVIFYFSTVFFFLLSFHDHFMLAKRHLTPVKNTNFNLKKRLFHQKIIREFFTQRAGIWQDLYKNNSLM